MRALIIDLNNFSRYPTLSVGYLAAILRQQDVAVDVCSPLSLGVHGFPRNVQEKPWQRYTKFLNHWAAVTSAASVQKLRAGLKKQLQPGGSKDAELILGSVKELLQHQPDAVLISAYTMYIDVCREIARLCQAQGVPVIVGGNTFVVEDIAKLWTQTPGISAVFAGEPEESLYELVSKLSKKQSIDHIPGVYTCSSGNFKPAEPLQNLDAVPFPDFSDFPWQSYPNRIVPVMTGRGCEWGRCSFCSDVLTSAGRVYRSRSIDNVLAEVRQQYEAHGVKLFVFLDLKLNSDLQVWRGLSESLPQVVPGIKWTASVHVDTRSDNGLSAEDLQKAAQAGLVRITCGLESASPKVLNAMVKGVKLNRMSAFIKNAHAAGISVRLTSIVGHPGEQAEDIDATTAFIAEHSPYIERITLNRFANMAGTPIQQQLQREPEAYPQIRVHNLDLETGLIPHENAELAQRSNLKSVFRLMGEVNKINRKPLIERAREFEGAF